MSEWKPWQILAPIVGVLALLGIPAVKVFQSGSDDLRTQLDSYIARESREDSSTKYDNARQKVEDLEKIAAEEHFGDLPPRQQQYVRERHLELVAFEEYRQRLEEIPDPRDVQNDEQLQVIRERLQQLTVPAAYQDNWQLSQVGRRHTERLAETAAIDAAAYDLRKQYQKLIDDGKKALKDRNAPNLPQRAREVLARGKNAPSPTTSENRLIPASSRVTYATIFRFPTVSDILAEWKAVQINLQPVAALDET